MDDKSTGFLYRLSEQCIKDSNDWFPGVRDPGYTALALCGEAGELANIIKKVVRGTMTTEEAEELIPGELADILVYLLEMAGIFGLDLEQLYHEKRRFNLERFGGGKALVRNRSEAGH